MLAATRVRLWSVVLGGAILLVWSLPASAGHGGAREGAAARVEAGSAATDEVDADRVSPLVRGACTLGRWAAVIDLLELVEPGQRALDDWLCLARAQTHSGRWVEALESYGRIADAGADVDDSASELDRLTQRVAASEGKRLEARLAWVSVVIEAQPDAVVDVSLDGEPVPRGRLGVPFAALPGERSFAVAVDGVVQRVERVRLAEGERRVVPISVHFAAGVEPERAPLRSAATRAEPRRLEWSRSTPSSRAWRQVARGSVVVGTTAFGAMLAAIPFGRAGVPVGVAGAAVAGVAFTTSGVSYLVSKSLESEPERQNLELRVGLTGASVSGRF